MRLFVLLSVLLASAFLTACRSTKSSARIYEGDGPNIRFGESHAGGPAGSR